MKLVDIRDMEETNEQFHHSSMYSVDKWRPSIIGCLSRHQGEFRVLPEFCRKWQEETPGAPQSDRPGSFYATEEKLEDDGVIIFRDGGYYLRISEEIVSEEMMKEIINEKITLVVNSCVDIQKNTRKINETIELRKEKIISIQDKIDVLKKELEIEKTSLLDDERRLNICRQDAEKNESQLINMIRDYIKEEANKN